MLALGWCTPDRLRPFGRHPPAAHRTTSHRDSPNQKSEPHSMHAGREKTTLALGIVYSGSAAALLSGSTSISASGDFTSRFTTSTVRITQHERREKSALALGIVYSGSAAVLLSAPSTSSSASGDLPSRIACTADFRPPKCSKMRLQTVESRFQELCLFAHC